jgi:hypothetical protein
MFLVPTRGKGMPAWTLCVLQECVIVLAGRGASFQAFRREAWEREKWATTQVSFEVKMPR